MCSLIKQIFLYITNLLNILKYKDKNKIWSNIGSERNCMLEIKKHEIIKEKAHNFNQFSK